jgi:uncharacterized protein (TIGR03435 family)
MPGADAGTTENHPLIDVLPRLPALPQQVKILPSLPATVQSQLHAIDGRNGKGLALGQSVPNLLETAYQVVQSRLILNAPVPGGEYDFITTYSQAGEAMTNLQREIKKTFGLTGRPEMIETNVQILTVQSPNTAGFKPSSGKFSNQTGPDFYSIRGATLYVLVADLEVSLGSAIVNETRLQGNFDIDLKWDSTPDGLKRVLRDELGLELTPGRETVPFLVVDKTN